MQSHYRPALLALAIATLTACGGGGSSGSGKDPVRNTAEPGNNDKDIVLHELEKGLYWLNMYPLYLLDTHPSESVFLLHNRMAIDNGQLRTESNILTPDGWVSFDDYFNTQPSSALVLTASGWQDSYSTPCVLDDTPGGVMLNCVGTQHRIDLEQAKDLAAKSLADTFTQIASIDLAYIEVAYQAVIAATAGLTSLLDDGARSYQFISTTQTESVITYSCQAATPGQPVAEWTCNDGFTSTSWEELAQNGDTFWQFDASHSIQVRLDGDPGNSNSGNMVVVESFPEGLEPGTVVGTWEKISVNSQSIIRLIVSEGFDKSSENALAIVNDRIVRAWYDPVGERTSVQVYNAEAAEALNDAAIGIFPVSLEPYLPPPG